MAVGPTQGPIDDGEEAAGFPVQVGGVDSSGNVHTLSTQPSGILLTDSDAIRRLLEEILIELRLQRGVL